MFSNRKKIKIQGKTAAHKRSLVRSQVIELIRNEQIKTTPKKAKLLKMTFDKLVTQAKKGTDSSKRNVNSFFRNNDKATDRLYSIIDAKLGDRTSGYTRIIKTTNRSGDNAEQVYVMLVNSEAKEKKSVLARRLERQGN